MKYKVRAISLKHVNQTEEILVWFKGALLYRTSEGERKFVFPWNVNKIKLSTQLSFPITFWGIKGSQKLSIEEINFDVIKWDTDLQWSVISKRSKLENLDEANVINAINQAIPVSIEPLDILKEKTNINYTIPKILDTTKDVIP